MLNSLEKSYPKAMIRGVEALDMEGENNDEVPSKFYLFSVRML
jgi:hypothetical protein